MKYKNIKTTKYRNKPVKKAGVKPKTIDKTTESTEPRTDIVPLTPLRKQNQINCFSFTGRMCLSNLKCQIMALFIYFYLLNH